MFFIFLILSILQIPLVDNFNHNGDIHEFHLSKCEIEFNNIQNSIEISIQLFIDDTEEALATIGKNDLKLFSDQEDPSAEDYIHEYLSQHLSINIDGQRYTTTWVGKEISEDLAGLWCYLQIEDVNPIRHIEVTNNVLMELFDDQRNIVKIRYDKDNKAYLLLDSQLTSGELHIKS